MTIKGFYNSTQGWKIKLTALPFIIFAITATMAIGTTAILWTQHSKDKLLILTNEDQLGSTAAILFDMRLNEYKRLVSDYSFWDEMVSFTNDQNKEWRKQNLDILIQTYNASAAAVLNRHDSIIYFATDSLFTFPQYSIIKPWVIKEIKNHKVYQTFIVQKNQLIEITGATIHPTADEKRKTKPSGILVVCKIWDQSVINIFSKAIAGQVELRHNPLNSNITHAQITYNYPIKGENNQTLAYLTLTKSIKGITENKDITNYIAIATLILAIISTLMLLMIIRRMITKPLILLGEIMSEKDAGKTQSLKNYGAQFLYLGELIDAYIKQREQLNKALEKATESDRLKSAFLANMSHEIRTPLNGILGFSQLVCNPTLSNEKRQLFQHTITKCGKDLLKIINDVLDISKIESGQVTVTNSWFSVMDLLLELETTYPIILKQYKKEYLKIRFQRPETDIFVCLDKPKVKQVLINLINNAIKYTHEGSVDVRYKLDEGTIYFEVKDTGEGIPIEEQSKLFQRFTQINSPNVRQSGVGLGLAIAKGLTAIQNGTIELKSELGKGSSFLVAFPICLPSTKSAPLLQN